MSKKKVLIVDDSAVVRNTLKHIFDADGRFEVIGAASNPLIAVQKLKTQRPDVITLDVEMPKMDGITFLKKIMSQHPIPIVIISSLTGKSSDMALLAMESGAVDVIQKPNLSVQKFINEAKVTICDSVYGASRASLRKLAYSSQIVVREKNNADVMLAKSTKPVQITTTEKVICIGASTGGTQALTAVLTQLPIDSPAIMIVQHMAAGFTKKFADRINELCAVYVKEAEDNDTVLRGQVLIAPGGKHLLLKRSGTRYYAQVKDGPLVSRHKPSVDVLFRSAARYAGKNTLGILLTGMGDDGANGLLELKEVGAETVAQDEKTSTVFGMPKVAIEKGAVNKVVSLDKVHEEIIQFDTSKKLAS